MDRIQQLKAYLAASPTDSFLQHALGLEYIKLGEEEQAIRRRPSGCTRKACSRQQLPVISMHWVN